MALLRKVTIENFKSFRNKIEIDLADGNYFIGANNSGKSTVLQAIRYFFDSSLFCDESFINKTSYLSRQKDSNIVKISIEFDLNFLKDTRYKKGLIAKYGKTLKLTQQVTITRETKAISLLYELNGRECKEEEFPDDVLKLVKSVKVTYLHPQEGQVLFEKAQQKLKQRLLDNWGRNANNMTQSIKESQVKWSELRERSNVYLSTMLTDNIRSMWPEGEVSINLPKDIRELIAISDIDFSGYKGAPEIDLTHQGTGAQSTILYLTHFLLDSDRSLHRGEYHPLWLLEEPESFLHSDLLAELAKQLNSDKWLDNIQMMVSTHSPILLANSRIAGEKTSWTVLRGMGALQSNKPTAKFSDDEIKAIGKMMGDANFYAYFLAAQAGPLIFVEDEKELTVQKYIEAGIDVAKGLKGTSEIVKFLDVFLSAPYILHDKAFFIVDSDKGRDSVSRFYEQANIDKEENGFKRFKVIGSETTYLIFLPDGFAAEDLFSEFDNHLRECVSRIWDRQSWKIKAMIPRSLTGVVSKAKRQRISNEADALGLIKNEDDIKCEFWEKAGRYGYKISSDCGESLRSLLRD